MSDSTQDDPVQPGPRPIGFWLKLVDRLIDDRFAETLDEHGVTRRQWQLLSLLRRGPASREELEVAIAPFTAAQDPDVDEALGEVAFSQLDELLDSEWVASTPSGYVLLPKGEQSYDRLEDLVDGIRSTVSSGITDDAYATTVATLAQMARNLDWRES